MGELRNWLFFGDFVRLHVLYRAAERPVGGAGIVSELRRHGYRLSLRKVQAVLRALERAGYLTGYRAVDSSNRRRYFEITVKGQQVMAIAEAKIHQLAAEILQDFPESTEDCPSK